MATSAETQIMLAFKDNGMNDTVASLAVAQAKVESQNFTSKVFRTDNNAFGYKYVGQLGASQGLPVPSSETENGNPKYYAHYDTVYKSGDEMARWLIRNVPNYNTITTPLEYASALENSKIGSYFSEPASVYASDMLGFYQPINVTPADVILYSGKYLNKTTLFIALGVGVVGTIILYLVYRKKM